MRAPVVSAAAASAAFPCGLRGLALAAILAGIAGCGPDAGAEGGRPASGAAPGAASFEPSRSAATGQTCTDGWREHGHTNQREAQAFLTRCLADQGVTEERMTREAVLATAARVIPATSPLASLSPSDAAAFCPGYAAADAEGRADFWRVLLTAIARPESDYRTTASLWEGGGLDQFSIGLLQLSYTDRARGCDFTNEADIADPARNLDCGARIMTKLVESDGVIGGGEAGNRGGARYWSTLRSTSDARAEIIAATRSASACGGG